MRTRVGLLAVAVSVAGMTGAPGEAQQAPTSPRRSSVSTKTDQAIRTPWGDPDLQGIWDYSSPTPMERPAALASKAFLTEEEAAALDRQGAEQAARTRAEAGREAWWEAKGTRPGGRRTSLVTTPDGKSPSLTPEAKKSLSEQAALIQAPPGGPEDRSVTERCIKGFNSGPPMDPHEFACHEGNSSMLGMLAGARADERAAKAKDSSPR